MSGKFTVLDNTAINFCKKFFSRKPTMTIVAHVLTSDDNESVNQPRLKSKHGGKKSSNCCSGKSSKKSRKNSSEDDDVVEEISRDSDPAIPTPPFPDERNMQVFPFDVKHEEKAQVSESSGKPSDSDIKIEEKVKGKAEEKPFIRKENTVVKQRNSKTKKPNDQRKNSGPQKKSYITSVETWQPATVRIICKNCGKKSRPILRTYTRRLATSKTAAAWVLTCWPLCFLPCLTRNIQQQFLYCSKCDYCLGEFQQKKR